MPRLSLYSIIWPSRAIYNIMGRIVLTHSTYVDGLIVLLKKIIKQPKIKTITPGVITRVKGHTDKLELNITREIRGGFKLKARKGRTAQDVFIITSIKGEKLEIIISEAIK